MPLLHQLPLDRSLIESSLNSMKQVLVEKTPPSPMPPPSMSNTSDYLSMNQQGQGSNPLDFNKKSDEDMKENLSATNDGVTPGASGSGSVANPGDDRVPEPPAIVIYIVDPFSFGPASDNLDSLVC